MILISLGFSANYYVVESSARKPVFSTVVLKGGADENAPNFEFKDEFPATKVASIYTKEATTKSGFYKALWGRHYSEFCRKTVSVSVVLLDALMGGLTPIKRGGNSRSPLLGR